MKFKTADVAARLVELGLSEEILLDVVRQGHFVFISASPNDPPLSPGFTAWSRMVRALREHLLPKGWSRTDESNYSLVVNADEDLAIAVATGNEHTGDTTESPTTKSTKGTSTVEAVANNSKQLNLFAPDVPAPGRPIEVGKKRMTWLLLVHRTLGEVRCELSLPKSMGTDGRIDAWRERIILSSIQTDPDEFDVHPKPDELPDITIEIKRRDA